MLFHKLGTVSQCILSALILKKNKGKKVLPYFPLFFCYCCEFENGQGFFNDIRKFLEVYDGGEYDSKHIGVNKFGIIFSLYGESAMNIFMNL